MDIRPFECPSRTAYRNALRTTETGLPDLNVFNAARRTHAIQTGDRYAWNACWLRPGALSFYPSTPCRIADTRNPPGPFGGPSLIGTARRSLAVPSSDCGIPSGARKYSLNATVVPPDEIGFLTLYGNSPPPFVSTLNDSADPIDPGYKRLLRSVRTANAPVPARPAAVTLPPVSGQWNDSGQRAIRHAATISHMP